MLNKILFKNLWIIMLSMIWLIGCSISGSDINPSCSFGGGGEIPDETAPTVYIDYPDHSSIHYYRVGTNFEINGLISDSESGIVGLYYSTDSNNYTLLTGTANLNAGADHSFSVKMSVDNYHTNVYLYANDTNGNRRDVTLPVYASPYEATNYSAKNNLGTADYCNATIPRTDLSLTGIPRDSFTAYLHSGQTYTIYTSNHIDNPTNTPQTIIAVQDDEWNTLSSNIAPTDFTNLTFNCTETSRYYIQIYNLNTNDTGTNYYGVGII